MTSSQLATLTILAAIDTTTTVAIPIETRPENALCIVELWSETEGGVNIKHYAHATKCLGHDGFACNWTLSEHLDALLKRKQLAKNHKPDRRMGLVYVSEAIWTISGGGGGQAAGLTTDATMDASTGDANTDTTNDDV